MRLEDLDFNNPLKNTIYGERYLNDTRGRFQDYSEVNPAYDPQGKISTVDLPYTLLTQDRCIVLKSQPSKTIEDWVRSGNQYRFFWHPDVERNGFKKLGVARTQPTSSTRTLLTEDEPHVYVKTDLDKKHFRFIRRLQRSSVEHSIAINNDLRTLVDNMDPETRYSFLPESLGLVVRGGQHEGSGVIFRETTPYPFSSEERLMLPYHALYAEDPHKPDDKPLVVQIVETHGGTDKVDYFAQNIAGPLLEAWVLLTSTRGLLPELHGQNSLAEIDTNFNIKRVVHRDFQGTYSDSRLRTNQGLPVFTKHVAGNEPGTTVQSQYSHVFDGMIGRYLLLRLSNTFSRYFGTDVSYLSEAIKSYHHSIYGWTEADFPSTTFRFGQPASLQVDNEVQLVDSGEKPLFR